MTTIYIWQLPDWPRFRFDADALLPLVGDARSRQGRFRQLMADAGLDARSQAELEATAEDVVKSSAIEGETLDRASVRSSIARRLGIEDGRKSPVDRRIAGIVDMAFDAHNGDAPLTAARLFGWHAALFPTGYSGVERIDVGRWRTDRHGAMQVVSNTLSPMPTIHYQAPPAARIAAEMDRFLSWFAGSQGKMEPLLRAGLAHLWFVTVHPFDDGNGRIARAVADVAIAQMEGTGRRFYSVSSQIDRDKVAYYDTLERTQKGTLDVTGWLSWFVGCYDRAVAAAERTVDGVLAKARFWRVHEAVPFNDRQRKALGKLLDGFEGGMTAKKWAAMNACSADTAQRDINGLVERGLLVRNPGGSKNTSYRFTGLAPAAEVEKTD